MNPSGRGSSGKSSGLARFDEFGNPIGKDFDLGSFDDQRIEGERILLYVVVDAGREDVHAEQVVAAVAERGLHMDVVLDNNRGWAISDARLSEYTQLWHISDLKACLKPNNVQQIKKFNEAGNGLLIWADNDPYYADANLLSQAVIGTTMSGNTMADRILEPGATLQNGVFIEHPLTTGLNNLYEGITICSVRPAPDVTILAQSHDGANCMACFERGDQRVVIDTGFTKICGDRFYRTPGTGRYFRNIAFWLARGTRDSEYSLLTKTDKVTVIGQGEFSLDYRYELEQEATLVYILNWEGVAKLGIEIRDPSAAIHTKQSSETAPIKVEIPNAQPGMWRAMVSGIRVQGSSVPYTLNIVERKQGMMKL